MEKDNIQTVLDVAAAAAEVRVTQQGPTGEIPFIALPPGYGVHNLEHLLPAPTHKRASVSTTDATSFIDYLNKHGEKGVSTIYANVDTEKSYCFLIAVVDDNAEAKPSWRDHTCTFTPKQSVEWGRWLHRNKQQMKQGEFASWLEDNLPDIANVPGMPTGAEILAMALGFEANSEKRLRSKINLQNGGVRFEFVDDEDKDTKTSMEVFQRFTLGLPVFDGSANAYPLEARLKYREKTGELTFWYELIRPDRVFKSAVTDELDHIKQGTSLEVIYGDPRIGKQG